MGSHIDFHNSCSSQKRDEYQQMEPSQPDKAGPGRAGAPIPPEKAAAYVLEHVEDGPHLFTSKGEII